MLSIEFIDSIAFLSPQEQESNLIPYFETSFESIFHTEIQSFFHLPTTINKYNINYPFKLIDSKFSCYISGTFECMSLATIISCFAISPKSHGYRNIRNYFINVYSENEYEDDLDFEIKSTQQTDNDDHSLVVPVVLVPLHVVLTTTQIIQIPKTFLGIFWSNSDKNFINKLTM